MENEVKLNTGGGVQFLQVFPPTFLNDALDRQFEKLIFITWDDTSYKPLESCNGQVNFKIYELGSILSYPQPKMV